MYIETTAQKVKTETGEYKVSYPTCDSYLIDPLLRDEMEEQSLLALNKLPILIAISKIS